MNAINSLHRLHRFCLSLSPWQSRGFVFLMGALSVLALAPIYALPILFITVPLFLFCHDGCRTQKQGFWLGWWFGFGYFTFGLYWISYALFVDIARFWWVIPFAVMGLPFGLSFFWGGASALLTRIRAKGVAKWLLFAVLMTATEWLRGHIFTGFPWNLLGYVWVKYPAFLQGASWVGVYGLTLYTFLLVAFPYLLLFEIKGKRRIPLPYSILLGTTIILGMVGVMRVHKIDNMPRTETFLRLVQPNIAQKEKWDPEKMPHHFDKLAALSAQDSSQDIDVVIWPETAVGFTNTFAIRQFEATIPKILGEDSILVTGVLDIQRKEDGDLTAYNRIRVVDRDMRLLSIYDKHHLVPFGEYLPFERFWPVNPIASNGLMFTPGSGIKTVDIGGIPPFSPLICYEVIFPNAVANGRSASPDWLLNLTNDAWYGYTSGPFQHLAITQMRAVEEGIPLVRVANTGISAVSNAAGKIVVAIPLQTTGVADVTLPARAGSFYAIFGDTLFFLILFGFGGLGYALHKRDVF